MYWLTEKIAKGAGRIFVAFVFLLTSSVVVNYYYIVFPWNYERWPLYWSLINIIVSIWLLVNIVFHYYMGVTTEPGHPPAKIANPVSVCKNCITAKPPRTHHCGICRSCILKMDHHCPWLNNCVGHLNHRYFYLFCLYMCTGTIFVWTSIYNQFRTYFPGNPWNVVSWFSTPVSSFLFPKSAAVSDALTGDVTSPATSDDNHDSLIRVCVLYEFALCLAVTVALSGLLVWHSILISRGETSIERHINRREKKRLQELGADYKNPHDFGVLENWKVLFGIEQGTGRSWLHVIFPSAHRPTGDGVLWRTVNTKSQ